MELDLPLNNTGLLTNDLEQAIRSTYVQLSKDVVVLNHFTA